jgi:hypothetical protein
MISPQLTPRIGRWLEAVETPSRGFRRRVNTTSVSRSKSRRTVPMAEGLVVEKSMDINQSE